MASLQQIALLLLALGVGAYVLFGRGATKSKGSPTATPANGAAKGALPAASAGRDFVKAMELAVSTSLFLPCLRSDERVA